MTMKPWEKYQQASNPHDAPAPSQQTAKPWEKYTSQAISTPSEPNNVVTSSTTVQNEQEKQSADNPKITQHPSIVAYALSEGKSLDDEIGVLDMGLYDHMKNPPKTYRDILALEEEKEQKKAQAEEADMQLTKKAAYNALTKHYGREPTNEEIEKAVAYHNDRPAREAEAEYNKANLLGKMEMTTSDYLNRIGDGMAFGYGPEASAAITNFFGGDTTVDKERSYLKASKVRTGAVGDLADFGGSMAMPVGLGGKLATGGANAIKGLKGVLARSAIAAPEAAAYGALYGSGHNENDRLGGAISGATIGAVSGGLGNAAVEGASKSISKIAGLFNKKPQVASYQSVKDASKALYKEAEETGLTASQNEVGKLFNNIQDIAKTEGLITPKGRINDYYPKVKEAFKVLDDYQSGSMGIKQMQAVRDIFADASRTTQGKEKRIASMFLKEFDNFVGNKAPQLKEARTLYERTAKVDKLNDLLSSAELRAASSGTGGNTENAIRQNLRRFAEGNSRFTDDEANAIINLVRGEGSSNITRLLSKYAPSGPVGMAGSIMTGAGAGFGTGGQLGALIGGVGLPLAGLVANKMAQKGMSKKTQNLIDLILSGGNAKNIEAPMNKLQQLLRNGTPQVARNLGVANGLYFNQ